jgi:hypothetical protein
MGTHELKQEKVLLMNHSSRMSTLANERNKLSQIIEIQSKVKLLCRFHSDIIVTTVFKPRIRHLQYRVYSN